MEKKEEDPRWRERKSQRASQRRDRKRRMFKRTREQLEETDEQRLLRMLIDLCRETEEPIDQRLQGLIQRLQDFFDDENFYECIMDCIVELSSKTSLYSSFIGMLKMEYGNLVEKLLVKLRDEFCLALNQTAMIRSRMFLRFLSCLVRVHVIAPTAFLTLIDQIMDCALSLLQSGQDPIGRSWQPWTDHLVYIILIALPWGGNKLMESPADGWNQFFEKVETYINQRPIQRDAALSPFLAATKENDQPAKSDSGGASFLSELWTAIGVLRGLNSWKSEAIPEIPEILLTKFQNSTPFELPQFDIPKFPPTWRDSATVVEKAAVLNEKYLPRGGVDLLDAQHTHPNGSEIDKIIVEEYILDTLWNNQASRVDCVRRITHQIPSPFPIFPLVAQTLFSQLLLLPRPPLPPVTYSTIIINLCKIPDEAWAVFPRGLSACVREIFSRLSVMNPELRERMMEWLSLHLSNLSFMWPWSKWKKVMESPPYHPQRLFVQGVLTRLVDLSYLKKVKESLTAEEFHALLPLEAAPRPLEEIFGSSGTEDQMEVDGCTIPKDFQEQFSLLVNLIKQKSDIETVQSSMERFFTAPTRETLHGFFCVLLICGDKNLTHTVTMLSRYSPLLEPLVAAVGQQSQQVISDSVLDVWKHSTHRCCMILDHLLNNGFITAQFLVHWIFQQLAGKSEDQTVVYWEVLKSVIGYGDSVMKRAQKEISDVAARVQHAKESAEDAAKRATEAAELVESGDTIQVSAMLDAINEATQSEVKAQQQVLEAEAQLHATNTDQMNKARQLFRDILIRIYEGFAQLLKEVPGSDSEDSRRIYLGNVVKLGSFACVFSDQSIEILSQIDDIFSETKVSEMVRKAIQSNLRLGLEVDANEVIYDPSFFSKK